MSTLSLAEVSLGLPTNLKITTIKPHKPGDLNDSDLVDSREKLKKLFDEFKETVTSLGISPEIFSISSGGLDPEVPTYWVVIKKLEQGMNFYCEAKAAIFVVEIDGKTTSIRHGFGAHTVRCSWIGKEGVIDRLYEKEFVPVSTFKEEFQRFLETILPEVIKCDKAFADGQRIPPWLAVRIINDWPLEDPTRSKDLILIENTPWNRDILLEKITEGGINLIKENGRISLQY